MTSLLSFVLFSLNSALWLVWGSLILSIFTPVSDLTWLVPSIALGGAVAAGLSSKKQLRFAGIIPAVAALLLCKCPGDYLLTGPAVGYLFLCICRNTLQPDPDAFYRSKIKLLVIAIGTLICIAVNRAWAFRCGVIGMGCLIYLMRLLRHDQLQPRAAALEIIPVGTICGICILISSKGVLHAAAFLLKKLYFCVIYPLVIVALNLVLGLLWCLGKLFKPLSIKTSPMEGIQFDDLWQKRLLEDAAKETGVPFPQALAHILGAILFLLILWAAYRYFKKGMTRKAVDAQGTASRISILSDDRETSSPGILNRSPEAKIRRIYAAYCKDLLNEGIILSPDDTTRSIEQKAGSSDSADALRELYLRARYRTGSGLSSSDAKQAATLYRHIKNREKSSGQ